MKNMMNLPLILSALKDQLPCQYQSIYLRENNTIHSSYPSEWVTCYTQNLYEKNDYAIIESRKTPLPIYWDKELAYHLPKQQRRIFNEAQDFNIYCGVSMQIFAQKGVVTLSSSDKNLSLNTYDYLCTALNFLNYLCLMPQSSVSLSRSDTDSLFNKFKKEREKISQKHHSTLFKALHHIYMGRLYLDKTLFSYEKESAMKDMAKGAALIDRFLDKTFKLIKEK